MASAGLLDGEVAGLRALENLVDVAGGAPLYVAKARPEDFQSYSETKLFYDGGFNVIDGTIAKDGDRYVLIAKDETKSPVAKKHLRLSMGSQAIGPYGPAGEPITPDWVEGPSVLKLGSAWVVYFDEYTRKRYGAIRTTDWKTWTNISDQIDLPAGTRHGTAFQVPAEIVAGLMRIAPQ